MVFLGLAEHDSPLPITDIIRHEQAIFTPDMSRAYVWRIATVLLDPALAEGQAAA